MAAGGRMGGNYTVVVSNSDHVRSVPLFRMSVRMPWRSAGARRSGLTTATPALGAR